jgi:hypothetical protein
MEAHGVWTRQPIDLMKKKYEKWAIFCLKGTILRDKKAFKKKRPNQKILRTSICVNVPFPPSRDVHGKGTA